MTDSQFQHERLFEANYHACRTRFRDAASQIGWQLGQLRYDADGLPDLTVDWAMNKPVVRPANSSVLIISSGLHGVEGYVGAAIQTGILEGRIAIRPDQRIILIHGLNPFGFYSNRRMDEANVDLNRNFLLADESYSGCHQTYRALDTFLNPRRPLSRFDAYYPQALFQIARHGMSKLRCAIAEGQYEFPRGLFYGGQAPAQSHRIIHELLGKLLNSEDHVFHLDVHSGLGSWADCSLLFDATPDVATVRELERAFSDHQVSFENQDQTTYRARGSLGQWCRSQQFCASYNATCMEFGTYGGLHMLKVLRSENCVHHSCAPETRQAIKARRLIREAFCPGSQSWRRSVIQHSERVIAGAQEFLRAGR